MRGNIHRPPEDGPHTELTPSRWPHPLHRSGCGSRYKSRCGSGWCSGGGSRSREEGWETLSGPGGEGWGASGGPGGEGGGGGHDGG